MLLYSSGGAITGGVGPYLRSPKHVNLVASPLSSRPHGMRRKGSRTMGLGSSPISVLSYLEATAFQVGPT